MPRDNCTMTKKQQREKRPLSNEARRPFGAMQERRDRNNDLPSYAQILFQHGFIDRHDTQGNSWSLYQRVCEDAEVRRLSQKIEKSKHPALVSHMAGYSHHARVLAAMSSQQLSELKKRVGVRQP